MPHTAEREIFTWFCQLCLTDCLFVPVLKKKEGNLKEEREKERKKERKTKKNERYTDSKRETNNVRERV